MYIRGKDCALKEIYQEFEYAKQWIQMQMNNFQDQLKKANEIQPQGYVSLIGPQNTILQEQENIIAQLNTQYQTYKEIIEIYKQQSVHYVQITYCDCIKLLSGMQAQLLYIIQPSIKLINQIIIEIKLTIFVQQANYKLCFGVADPVSKRCFAIKAPISADLDVLELNEWMLDLTFGNQIIYCTINQAKQTIEFIKGNHQQQQFYSCQSYAPIDQSEVCLFIDIKGIQVEFEFL